MKVQGELTQVNRDMDGNLLVTLAIDDSIAAQEELKNLDGVELDVEIKKHNPKRSLNSNALLWKMCDAIAKVIRSDKDTVYLIQLSKYGLFTDIQIDRESLPMLKKIYRYVEEFDEGDENTAFVRCYIGSSTYDRAEMHRLLEGTLQDARDLGINTWSEDEIERINALWNSQSN